MRIRAQIAPRELEETCFAAAPLTLKGEGHQAAFLQLVGPFQIRLEEGLLHLKCSGRASASIRDVPTTREAPALHLTMVPQTLGLRGTTLVAHLQLEEFTLSRPPGPRAIATNSRLRRVFSRGMNLTLAVDQFLDVVAETNADLTLRDGSVEIGPDVMTIRTYTVLDSTPPSRSAAVEPAEAEEPAVVLSFPRHAARAGAYSRSGLRSLKNAPSRG